MELRPAPRVAVVVPYYRQQHQLDLVLTALDLQTYPAELLQVVVADDGSPDAPRTGGRRLPVRTVRQPDRGFRAAAARNLGAAACDGDVLLFLDADTVPEPGYVEAMVRRLAAGAGLVVGRRRHAELADWSPERLRTWFGGTHPGPAELPEPQWLIDAYRRTADLTEAGDDAYRFVISAVLGVTRALFDRVGGFEEAFDGYGGEDWEFAHRCWLAGADFAHEPAAVAWHDGPDFAGRDADRRELKNREAMMLARFVTDPACRGHALLWEQPDVVVRLDDAGADDEAVLLCVASLVRDTDAGVWLTSGRAARHGTLLGRDPRIRLGEPDPDVLARCRYRVDADRPVELAGVTLRELCARAPARGPGISVHRTRDLSRGTPPPAVTPIRTRDLSEPDLGRTFGRWAKSSI